MSLRCSKRREGAGEEAVSCSEVHTTWECQKCGRRIVRFVVPYRICTGCGGPLLVVACAGLAHPRRMELVREALQLLIDTFLYYRLALEQATDRVSREFLSGLLDHVETQFQALLQRHRLASSLLELDLEEKVSLARELGFPTAAGLLETYRRALALEQRSMAHAEHRALSLPPREAERELHWKVAERAAERAVLLEKAMFCLSARVARQERSAEKVSTLDSMSPLSEPMDQMLSTK